MICKNVYLDVGTNVGWQVQKLYDASFPSPVQKLFNLLGTRSSVCTVMIEPNPKHAPALSRIVNEHKGKVQYIRALASTMNGKGAFFANSAYIDGMHNNDWTGSEISQHGNQQSIETPKIDLGAFIQRYSTSTALGMKLDIEGSEEWLLPHLERLDVLCNMKFVYTEAHNQATARMIEDMIRRHNKRACPVQIRMIDDEIPYTSTMFCLYAFGTNTGIGTERIRKLKMRVHKRLNGYNLQVKQTETPPDVSSWSVSCLKQIGYIGMWLSMLRVWRRAFEECRSEWTVLLEADALLPTQFDSELNRVLNSSAGTDIVWLDERAGQGEGPNGCCTVAMAYRTSTLPFFIYHFDPTNLNAYWNNYTHKRKDVVNHDECLTDWYLGNLVQYLGLRARRDGIAKHAGGDSEINLVG